MGGAHQLDERVSLSKAGCFLGDLLGSGESLQLLTARRNLGLICGGLGHALVVQAGEVSLVFVQGLGGHCQVTLCGGFLLLVG